MNVSLSNSNWIRTHNDLVPKQTLNHLTKIDQLIELYCSTYLDGVFDSVLLYHVRVSESTLCNCLNVKEECRFTLKRVSDMIITHSVCLCFA